MAVSEKDLDLIELYLDGDMDTVEATRFKSRLENEADLAREYQLQNDVVTTFKEREKLKSEFRDMYAQAQSKKSSNSRTAYLAMAAVISLLLVAFIFFLINSPVDHKTIYAEHYSAFAADGALRGDNSIRDRELALQLYAQGNYSQAAQAFEKLVGDNATPTKEQIYLANSYMNTGETSKAIELLKYVGSSENSFLRQYANWYLSLAYVQDGDINAAISLSKQIIAEGGIYKKEATALLNDLE